MKPDKSGQWHSRDGRAIVVWRYFGELWYRNTSDDNSNSRRIGVLPGDDWLLAVAPTFPELPPKPIVLQCFVFTKLAGSGPFWRAFDAEGRCLTSGNHGMTASQYVVAHHPDNDPAAEKLIKDAQR